MDLACLLLLLALSGVVSGFLLICDQLGEHR